MWGEILESQTAEGQLHTHTHTLYVISKELIVLFDTYPT